MSTHKAMDRICVAAVVLSLLLTIAFINGEALGLQPAGKVIGYEKRLFDSSRVHTIEIVMDDWDGFIETCQGEEYSACSVVIDGESYKNVGIRGKGNTSLSSVAAMGSSRYSFKIEFDQYDGTKSYHGLDKLCLNNLIQDNTMMKDYLTYRLMNAFDVASPLCSFVYITVNGEDWGLYLAVEGVEDAFLQRNYGSDYGKLYKPDSLSFGGGRGNGRNFDMNGFANRADGSGGSSPAQPGQGLGSGSFTPPSAPGGSTPENTGENPSAGQDTRRPANTPPEGADTGGFEPSSMFGGGGFGFSFGSTADVKLQYIDDDPDSYANIFGSAKTDITKADQTRLISSLRSLSSFEGLENVLDMGAVLRYFVVHSFVVNGDSYTGSMVHNYYLYEEDGKLSMIPWDYNLAFGTFSGGAAASSVNDAIDDVLSDRPMQAWIFSDETYTQRYHELYTRFLSTVDVAQIIDDAYTMIAGYVEKDPTKFCTYEEFESGVQALRSFCSLRRESVQGQLAGTIPATSEGQNADPTALVSTGSLNLSDMGTMNNGKGPGGFGVPDRGGLGKPYEGTQPPAPASASDGGILPSEQGELANSLHPPGGDTPKGFTPPGNQTQSPFQGASILLLGVSALVLAAGIWIAFKYKR